MNLRKQKMTLGELIRAVSKYTHNDHELNLAVADLMNRGIVRAQKGHRRFRVTGVRQT